MQENTVSEINEMVFFYDDIKNEIIVSALLTLIYLVCYHGDNLFQTLK